MPKSKAERIVESIVRKQMLKESEIGDYKSDKRELVDMIYDTLLQNTQYPQLNLDLIEDQEVERGTGTIVFTYDGIPIKIKISVG